MHLRTSVINILKHQNQRPLLRVGALFFIYYVCIGMLITVNATVGDALFLAHVPHERITRLLPYVYVGAACATFSITWIYQRLLHHLPRIILLLSLNGFLGLSLWGFRLLLAVPTAAVGEWLYLALLLWLKMTSLLSVMLFFSFAGDYFTTHTAKRVYGYISGGTAFGSVLAGLLIGPIVRVVGAENLLYGGLALLLAGMGSVLYIDRVGIPVNRSKPELTSTAAPATVTTILNNRYLQLLFLATLLRLMIFVLVDVQMKISSKAVFSNSTELAKFFGEFYLYIGVVTLLVQFFVVKRLLQHIGILSSLMILPVLYMLMAAIFFLTRRSLGTDNTLLIIAATNFFRILLSDALEVPAREMLFLPLPTSIRVRAQAMLGGMVAPIGQGLGGLLIMGLAIWNLPLPCYSLLVFGLAVVWVGLLVLERPRYRETLATSLKHAQLEAAELSDLFQTAELESALHDLLNNSDEQVVSLTLDVFRKRSSGKLPSRIIALADDSNPKLAAKALALLGTRRNAVALPALERALRSPDATLRATAVLTFCQIQGEQALQRVLQWIDAPDPMIRRAALIGCGRYCGPDGQNMIRLIVTRMASSLQVEERVRAAQLLREIGDPSYLGLVETLIDDPETTVQAAAIEVCGVLRSSHLVSRLLELARIPELQPAVIQSLTGMPESSVAPIITALHDPSCEESLHNALLCVLAAIGGNAAQRALYEQMTGTSPVVTRLAAGRALRQTPGSQPIEGLKRGVFEEMVQSHCTQIGLFIQACQDLDDPDPVIWQLFYDHTSLEIEMLFQLLSIRYAPQQIAQIRDSFRSPDPIQHANALELLDELLPRRLAPGLIHTLDAFIETKRAARPGLSEACVQQLLRQEPWVQTLTRYHLARTEHPVIYLPENALNDQTDRLSAVVQRIIFLKQVPLFQAVPGNYLLPLASMAIPVQLHRGDVLFQQGDQGDAMYLICAGRVSIQVDGREINQMGRGECLGEMSVLDGAPRSAACLALEPTGLLKIAGNAIEILVKNQPEAALAMLRTLAGWLRQQIPPGSENRCDAPEPTIVQAASQDRTYSPHDMAALFEHISFLKNVIVFQDVPDNYLLPLARLMDEVTLRPGRILFRQGDHGDALYLVRQGQLRVQVNGVEVNVMEVGDCVGEMALLDHLPRSATCVAAAATTLLRMDAQDFEIAVRSQPGILFALLQALAKRLRQQTRQK